MSTTNGTLSTLSAGNYNSHEESNHIHGERTERVSNMSKLIGVELDYLKQSFETAKVAMDVVFVHIEEARNEYDKLMMQKDIRWEEKDFLLQELKKKENTIVKKGLFFAILSGFLTRSEAQEKLDELVAKGYIRSVYKKCNLIVGGYSMPPLVRSTLNDEVQSTSYPIDDYMYMASNIDQEDIIYEEPSQFLLKEHMSYLHLGTWQKLPTYHIEVPSPAIFFKNISNLDNLFYISLRGISMIIELPNFITKLRRLVTLDLKACHNLEVIPPDIDNLKTLIHLDMSECYFLDHMPANMCNFSWLQVLKGFFIGETNKDTCTLQDLVHLQDLEKLSIYTNVKGFPNERQLSALQKLRALRNLTISWGGCSVPSVLHGSRVKESFPERWETLMDSIVRDTKYVFMLVKLDLQCVPEMVTSSWLRPNNFRNLKKLYIRGGKLCDLAQQKKDKEDKGSLATEEDQWSVEILRFKYLKKLKMNWNELQFLFPKLIYLEKVECPNLLHFPCDDSGVWVKTTQSFATTSF